MADSNNSQTKEVKVEDLLRLKRSERPDEAFWDTFDRELHQRMLQTLVKKDSWYTQLLRGVSGRLAQTAAVGAAAAFLALMVVQPSFVDATNPSSDSQIAQVESMNTPVAVEVAMADLDTDVTPDYQIEAISTVSEGMEFTPDYSLDGFEVAGYDSEVYASDTAGFAVSGVATGLVY